MARFARAYPLPLFRAEWSGMQSSLAWEGFHSPRARLLLVLGEEIDVAH